MDNKDIEVGKQRSPRCEAGGIFGGFMGNPWLISEVHGWVVLATGITRKNKAGFFCVKAKE